MKAREVTKEMECAFYEATTVTSRGSILMLANGIAAAINAMPKSARVKELEQERDALKAEIDDKQAEISNLRCEWPEWASRILEIVRKHTGYDGYDDQLDGIDIPAEVSEAMEEYAGQIDKLKAELESIKAVRDALRKDAERYRWLRIAKKRESSSVHVPL